MTAPNIVRLDDFRRSRLGQPVATSSDLASVLAPCRTLLYVGITPDGEMRYGTSNVQYDDAVDMMEAAGYLIGELSKIISAGGR